MHAVETDITSDYSELKRAVSCFLSHGVILMLCPQFYLRSLSVHIGRHTDTASTHTFPFKMHVVHKNNWMVLQHVLHNTNKTGKISR